MTVMPPPCCPPEPLAREEREEEEEDGETSGWLYGTGRVRRTGPCSWRRAAMAAPAAACCSSMGAEAGPLVSVSMVHAAV